MKASVIDLAMAEIDKKIESLLMAKQHLLEAHEALGANASDDAAPKVRKTRKKRGLPAVTESQPELRL